MKEIDVLETTRLPEEAKKVEGALRDLTSVFSKHQVDYRVIGSLAMMGAAGRLYRVPADIDVLYDMGKEPLVREGLLALGYRQSFHQASVDVFPGLLQRYEKEGQVIEPRGGRFTFRGFEVPLVLPLMFTKLETSLVFRPLMIAPKEYQFGEISFFGLSKEALWLGLKSVTSVLEDSSQKRQMDLEILSEGLDEEVLAWLIQENSGLYYRNLPLATPNHNQLVSLIALGIRATKFLRSVF